MSEVDDINLDWLFICVSQLQTGVL